MIADPASKPTLARLNELITKVPPLVANGSYNLSVDFKAAVVKGIKTRHKRGLSEAEAVMAVRDLERFQ